MAGNEKYKNAEDIADGKFIPISENVYLTFYYKKPPESFTGILDDLSGISKIVLGMSTKVNSPEEIVKTIVNAVKNNPDILYFVPIVYNSPEEKNRILIGIIEGLGLKGNLRK